MATGFEFLYPEGDDPKWKMPYTPAIRVNSGALVFLAGVTAAGIYHSHPHEESEFGDIPDSPAEQAHLTMKNLERVLQAAGGEFRSLVSLIRFIVDTERNQAPINAVVSQYLGSHRPTSTLVEVVRLAPHPKLLFELSAIAVVD